MMELLKLLLIREPGKKECTKAKGRFSLQINASQNPLVSYSKLNL